MRLAPALTLALVLGALALGCRRDAGAPPAPTAHPREERAASPTSGALGAVTGDSPNERAIARAQAQSRAHPSDPAPLRDLARLWMREARLLQTPEFFQQAGDAVDRALALAPDDPQALALRGALLLQEHRFREARDLMRALAARGREGPEANEVLCDAATELGDYATAVDAAQRVLDARPDGPAYARAAWLRWLHGDAAGALDAMRLALDALPREPEARGWLVAQAAQLYFSAGDLENARRYYDAAAREFPPLAAAHAGLARVALAQGDAPTAVREAESAVRASPTAEHEWLAGDARAAAGERAEADAHYATLERTARRGDPRTLALYYAETNQRADEALALARRDYESRQDVFADDVLALALLRTGDVAGARAAMDRALRIHTPDARLRYHEALVLRAAGDPAGAADALRASLAQNPYFSPAAARDAREILAALAPLAAAGAIPRVGPP